MPRLTRTTLLKSTVHLLVAAGLVLFATPGHLSAQEPPRATAGSPAQWLSIDGSVRVRPEARWARRFRSGNDDSYTATQLRVGIGVQTSSWARLFVEAQDARAPGATPAGATLRGPADIYQAYAEFGATESMVKLRVGRQEMAYGQQRLISRNPWRNTGRSFDAARLMVGRPTKGVDLFASAIVQQDPHELDGWQDGEALYGAYGRLGEADSGLRVEPYVLARRRTGTAGRPGSGTRYSVGGRTTYRFAVPLDLAGEAVHQFGNVGDTSIDAWMAYAEIGSVLAKTGWHPRVEWEYSYASGDPDPDDRRAEGFDTLYSTPHRFYGYADLIGGRNLQHVRGTLRLKPAERVSVAVDLHRFWLATRSDTLYDTSLTPLVSLPSGGAATADVGMELDVTATHRLWDWLSVGGGWSRFYAGALVTRSASSGPSSFTYVVVESSF